MNKISILDCTLRDGGYVNDFLFGHDVIYNIISKLSKAGIDIIECGFLRSGAKNRECSLFESVEQIKMVIGNKNPNSMYVGMIQYGKISNDEISVCDGTSIDGIRVTFHENEIEEALILGKQLMEKGYKVFMQPVGTISYTDAALLKLIEKVNGLKPFAFYMVDTLGTMYKNDLLRMFYLVDNNLDSRISVGFHSHNNLQMSFTNAQELMQIKTARNLIIDASVLGMGRGAGNLCTELITQYVNSTCALKYDSFEILEIVDKYIRPLTAKYKWGYDAAYYVAAVFRCHPNYAAYLLNLQTVEIQDIKTILSCLEYNKRAVFDKEYISEKYRQYMSHNIDDTIAVERIKSEIDDKTVLLLAPGKSLMTYYNQIQSLMAQEDIFSIGINFHSEKLPVDMVFLSNLKRFNDIKELKRIIDSGVLVEVTSNIKNVDLDFVDYLNYSSYLNEESCISDNSGLMCINMLKRVGVKNIVLAGFDGFSSSVEENYFEESLYMNVEQMRLVEMNIATATKFKQLKSQMNIKFLSATRYEA